MLVVESLSCKAEWGLAQVFAIRTPRVMLTPVLVFVHCFCHVRRPLVNREAMEHAL